MPCRVVSIVSLWIFFSSGKKKKRKKKLVWILLNLIHCEITIIHEWKQELGYMICYLTASTTAYYQEGEFTDEYKMTYYLWVLLLPSDFFIGEILRSSHIFFLANNFNRHRHMLFTGACCQAAWYGHLQFWMTAWTKQAYLLWAMTNGLWRNYISVIKIFKVGSINAV